MRSPPGDTRWVGRTGSDHHRRLGFPGILDLLGIMRGEHILDMGCGPGVLAPHVERLGERYTGIDTSPKLLAFARRHHGRGARFLHADATALTTDARIPRSSFDGVSFLLSIQDIEPLDDALRSAAWAVRPKSHESRCSSGSLR